MSNQELTLQAGQRYWMRRGTKAEYDYIAQSYSEEVCGFCGREPPPRRKWTRLLVEIVPLQNPITICCFEYDEPPPGSFAMRILSGCRELNGQQRWCPPVWAILLQPLEALQVNVGKLPE